MNKAKIFIYIAIVISLFWWGRNWFPTRREISEIEATQVLGIDLENDGKVTLSIVTKNKGSGEEENNKNSKGSKEKEKIVSVTTDTLSGAIEGLQNYNDKVFIGGHVRNVIIGENMAKNSLVRAIDFLTKDKEVRFNINMFIAKESSAKELMEGSLSEDYELVDKFSNLVLTSKGNKLEEHTELLDVMSILISDDKNGVIPAAKVVKDGEYSREFTINVSNGNKERDEFVGYAVINNANVVDFLDINESTGYDYLNDKIIKVGIDIKRDDEVIGLDINNFKTNINFNFEDKELKEIIIKTNVKNTIAESSLGHNIFKENVEEVEKIASEQVKSQILAVIEKAKMQKNDFIGIKKILEMKHPYKWRNIKDNWNSVFSEVPVKIETECKINRTYDILGIVKADGHTQGG